MSVMMYFENTSVAFAVAGPAWPKMRVVRAVVVRVVPRKAALVAALLPERLHELHRLHGALAVDGDFRAARIGLGAAEAPEHRIREGRGVAEGVAEGLAVRLALLLELGEDPPRLVPGLRVPVGAHLPEPRPPVGDGIADDRVWQGEPLAADVGGRRPDVIEPALGPGQGGREVADVDERASVEIGRAS